MTQQGYQGTFCHQGQSSEFCVFLISQTDILNLFVLF